MHALRSSACAHGPVILFVTFTIALNCRGSWVKTLMKFDSITRRVARTSPDIFLIFSRETFSSCGLHDLGFSGYDFTWWNRRDVDQSVGERLDRYCATIEWSPLFPIARNTHIDAKLSDHLPIILKLKGNEPRSWRAKHRFKFENMWALDKDCEDRLPLGKSKAKSNPLNSHSGESMTFLEGKKFSFL
ncbi:hypothetical protein Cgig2_010083 [Carnegiea gigantea]|uniref:Endonuclease/exonuclease/phosphatase domain-containing protein n=1 Tax=Carnegiea gigantea TaxID=171969 RepID=A0A9Q1QLZ6_9CARY|nr:hypothetical protein Cgig2_010083 [Carnegiea gigantea]